MSSVSTPTRQKILKATLALLEAGDGNAVRMGDVAKRAGISRQALYLHFKNRAELLIAATYYLDEIKGAEARLAPSRNAHSGTERLEAYIKAWAGYLPEIYGMATALMAMSDHDSAAAAAWEERMQDMREGCAAAMTALSAENRLAMPEKDATDLLWTLLSVRNWAQLTKACGWTQAQYLDTITATAGRLFVKN